MPSHAKESAIRRGWFLLALFPTPARLRFGFLTRFSPPSPPYVRRRLFRKISMFLRPGTAGRDPNGDKLLICSVIFLCDVSKNTFEARLISFPGILT